MQRDRPIFELLRVNKPRVLPVVLSRPEVRSLLGAVQHPVRRVALTTIYALGLRLGEGLAGVDPATGGEPVANLGHIGIEAPEQQNRTLIVDQEDADGCSLSGLHT